MMTQQTPLQQKEITLVDDDAIPDNPELYSDEWVRIMERYREQQSNDRVKKFFAPDTMTDPTEQSPTST